MVLIRDEFGGGQNFCTFDTPYHACFIAFLRKNFRNLYFWYPQFLFEKFSNISKKFVKFFQLFQNRKNNIILSSN